MNKLFYTIFFCVSFVFAQGEFMEEELTSSADCLILEDENSIICKYIHERLQIDKELKIQWINPQGEISRERSLIIPAGHGSIYDFRYIEGREKGIWVFKVIEDGKYTTTSFTLE